MHIQRLRVLNYKSFRDSGFIELGPGFNVIVGQNNSGKTALLEAFGLHMGVNKPHRRRDVPADHPFDQQSRLELDLFVTGGELVDAIVRTQGVGYREKLEKLKETPISTEGFEDNEVSCKLFTIPGSSWQARTEGDNYSTLSLSAFGTFDNQSGVTENAFFFFVDHNQLASVLWSGFSGRIYAFKAERMNVSAYGGRAEPVLQPNAANLPAVLAYLFNSKRDLTARFNEAVSQVLPSIQWVDSRDANNSYRIFIQNLGTDPDRDDLSCSVPDDHIDPRRSAFFMARSVLRDIQNGVRPC